MKAKALTGFALSAALLFGTAEAEAQEWKPISRRAHLGADVYVWSAEGSGTSFPIVGFLTLELTDTVFLDIELPFTSFVNRNEDVGAGLGNPTVGVHWADEIADKVTLHLGGGLSLPVASLDERDWQEANVRGLFALAGHDSYLYGIDYIPVHGKFGVEYQPIKPIFLRASVEPIIAVPIGNGRGAGPLSGNDQAELVIQNTGEFEARADMGAGGGIALLPWWVPTERGDNAQLVVEPFFSFDNNSFIMRIGGRLALDRPLGPGFDRGRVATLHMMFGGHLN